MKGVPAGTIALWAVAALAGAAPARGGAYDLTLVVAIDPAGFDQIHSASLNAAGQVTFAGTIGPFTGVFAWTAELEVVKVGVNSNGFDPAFAPVIDDAGHVAFAGANASHRLGIFFVEALAPQPLPVLVHDADAPGTEADLLGQLAMNNRPAPDIAFWSACLGGAFSGCRGHEQCLGLVGGPGGPCASFPQVTITAPALNDGRTLAFLMAEAGTLRLLGAREGAEPHELLSVSQESGAISAPSLNDAPLVAVFARDDRAGLAPGIYLIDLDGRQQLAVPLPDEGPVAPAIGTRPWLSDAGAYAWLATLLEGPAGEGGTEGIFTSESPAVPVVSVGDPMFGATLSGSLQLFALNDAGQLLFAGRLDDALGTIFLAIATPASPSSPRCPADLDDSGEIDVSDLVQLIAAWGSAGPGADLDGGGSVGVEDLVLLMLAWGPCP